MAGCSGETRAPLTPATPQRAGYVAVEVNGVVHVPPEGTLGVQGRLTPWLVADNGTAYHLPLGTGFEPLSDPSNSGRGVAITGGIVALSSIPVGAEERSHRFQVRLIPQVTEKEVP
jgi:hypothetical protein